MKSERNILIAFALNLFFSVFEFAGGLFTGSVAILSDAIHDVGDAASIGISYFFEKLSKKKPDEKYTYGYGRYSVIGAVIATSILLVGSLAVIYNALIRIINPVKVNYDGMIVFALVGVCVNFIAGLFTKDGESVNQKAVHLHMLEDVLGWIVVLIGAAIMKFTDIKIIDPIMSVGVSVFILINACKNLKEVIDLFLEKTPRGICVEEIKAHVMAIDGVLGVHHIHIWSIDGQNNFLTMHVVTNDDACEIKDKIRNELKEHNIGHTTLELERENEHCHHEECVLKQNSTAAHHHHHHHHH